MSQQNAVTQLSNNLTYQIMRNVLESEIAVKAMKMAGIFGTLEWNCAGGYFLSGARKPVVEILVGNCICYSMTDAQIENLIFQLSEQVKACWRLMETTGVEYLQMFDIKDTLN